MLSDNFPERLKRLVLYPFPWYGNAIWKLIKNFIDARTADKVLLINCDETDPVPPEVAAFVDPKQIPRSMGGQDDRPVINLEQTLA